MQKFCSMHKMKTNCINKIILFCIILLSAIENVMAQGHLISLSKLKNEIIYIYDFGIFKGEEYVYDRFMMEELRIINKVSFDDYAKRHPEMVNQEFYIYDDCKFPNSIIINKSDLDTINRENVHRLILIGQYCDSIDFSQLYFPNLQELHLIYNEAFPKHIEIYKNLQVLDVVSLFGEEFMGDTYDSWKVTTLEKKGYRYPFIFPQEIYALKHLKILNFHLGGGFTYVTLSEQIGELRKLKALSMDGRTDNVVVPVSLLKKKRFNEDVMLSSPQKDRINFLSISRRKVSPYCIENSFSKDVFRKSDISLHKQLFRSSYVRTYQNKSPMIKGNYKKNKPHGKWLLFYEDRTLCQERFYKNGIEDSVWTFYIKYKDGDLMKYKIHFDTGKIVCLDIEWSDSSKEKIFNVDDYYNRKTEDYVDNQMFRKEVFSNGIPIYKEFYRNSCNDGYIDRYKIVDFDDYYKIEEKREIELFTENAMREKITRRCFDTADVLCREIISYYYKSFNNRERGMGVDSIAVYEYDNLGNLRNEHLCHIKNDSITSSEYDMTGNVIYQKTGFYSSNPMISTEVFLFPQYVKVTYEYNPNYIGREVLRATYYDKKGQQIKSNVIVKKNDYNKYNYREEIMKQ